MDSLGLDVEEKTRAKDTHGKGIVGASSTNFVQLNNYHNNKKKPQQNPTKTTQTTTFKKKKKGACYVCESLDHFAAKCLNYKGGKKSANMVSSEAGGTSRYSNFFYQQFFQYVNHLNGGLTCVVGQNPPVSSDRQHEEPGGSQDCWWAPVPRSTARNPAHALASGLLGVPPDLVPD
jgi:hypothetical protein